MRLCSRQLSRFLALPPAGSLGALSSGLACLQSCIHQPYFPGLCLPPVPLGGRKTTFFPAAQTRNLGALSALFAYPTPTSPVLSPSLGLGNRSLLSDSLSSPCYPAFSHQQAGSEPPGSWELPLVLSPHGCHSDLPKVQIQSCHLPLDSSLAPYCCDPDYRF